MRVIRILFCLVLAGCGTKSYTYNAAGIDESRLASIVQEDIGSFITGRELSVTIKKILDEKQNVIKEGTTGIAEELRLQPATYYFRIKCSDGNEMGSHRYVEQTLKLELQPGGKYIAYCVGDFKEQGPFNELVFVRGLAAISKISNFEMDKKKLLSEI